MKTTLEKAINAAQVIARLNAVRMKNTATARKLFSLKKLIEPHFEFYANEEKKIVEDLGGVVEENGSIVFEDQQEGLKKLKEAREELFKSECEIAIDKPIIFRDSEGVQVSGEEIAMLEGLADFIE